jgi:hypothetical protein
MSEYQFPKATVQHRLGGKAVDLAMYTVTFGNRMVDLVTDCLGTRSNSR